MENNMQSRDPRQAQSDGDEGASLGEMIGYFFEYKWLVVSVIVGFVAIALLWLIVSKPVYKAAGTVQIEEKAASALDAIKEIGPLIGIGGDTTVAAEQEILTSRMILGKVIEKQKLNLIAEARLFPIIGQVVNRFKSNSGPGEAWFGLEAFSWGGETIGLDLLDVPRDQLDKELRLKVLPDGAFVVTNDDDEVVLQGGVGKRVSSGGYEIFVSHLVARPGSEFNLVRLSQEASMEAFLKRYGIKERGKKSGILEVTLTGESQDQIKSILDDVLNTYVLQNVQRRSAEAENTLKFLETQLPAVKRQLDLAEAAYNNYRQSRGSLDLNTETQSVLASLVEIENQIVALKQERDELRQYFTTEHPRIQAVDMKLSKLVERRTVFDKDVARLPDTQQKVLQLARDVEVSTALYTNLVNTSQQLRVSKAGTVGDVRIVDSAAVSSQPIGIKPLILLAVACFCGAFVSAIVIWIKRTLNVVVEIPEEIEKKLGLPVYATIPHSNVEANYISAGKSGAGLLAISDPDDDAVESFRSLRTTLHFALMDAKVASVLITGSSPGLGKSFVSKNLAVVLAQAGKRIVIVDADLRRGHIHKEFGCKREGGVTEYVVGDAELEAVVRPTMVPNLWLVTTGTIPPNPGELLMSTRFAYLLERLGDQFDVVIVDAAPILAVSDAAIIGRHVGATLMIARAGKHPINELEQAVKRMAQAGVPVKGFVFNDLDMEKQKYRYGYSGYVYKYSYSKTSGGK